MLFKLNESDLEHSLVSNKMRAITPCDSEYHEGLSSDSFLVKGVLFFGVK